MEDPIARMIRDDVERLCASGDRALGTGRNREATAYVAERLRAAGTTVESIGFEVPEWSYGAARVSTADLDIVMHPGPFSPPAEGEGRLVVIRSLDDLAQLDAGGAVLLLIGEIAETQFTPRDYPFYTDAGHTAIVDALEGARPLAVLAATGASAMTGAMSPFPLFEDAGFRVPSAYMTEIEGARLARRVGQTTRVSIDSRTRPSTGEQPVGLRPGTGKGRIVVSAHVDSKPETPGAIDNAAGVAVMLAVAELLNGVDLSRGLEFVPFNGEDHALAPGEMAWLGAADLSDVELAINIDAPGLRGGPSAYSLYGVDDATRTAAARAAETGDVVEGPEWPASDHMIFVMRGIPAIAVTSSDFVTASRGFSHTPKDVPEILDFDLLAQTARFVADLIRNSD